MLGTSFRVFDRKGIFNVQCFSGTVRVQTDNRQEIITKGEEFGFAFPPAPVETLPQYYLEEIDIGEWDIDVHLFRLPDRKISHLMHLVRDTCHFMTGSMPHPNTENAYSIVQLILKFSGPSVFRRTDGSQWVFPSFVCVKFDDCTEICRADESHLIFGPFDATIT